MFHMKLSPIRDLGSYIASAGPLPCHGMEAGENTLNAMACRVMQQALVAKRGLYEQAEFLGRYTSFMTRPGSHNDSTNTYAEAFHRQFMANFLLRGKPAAESGGEECHDTPSVGGFVMLPPVLGSAVLVGKQAALAPAEAHLRLTHKSDRLVANMHVYATALFELLSGAVPAEGSKHDGDTEDEEGRAARVCATLERAGQALGVMLPKLAARPCLRPRLLYRGLLSAAAAPGTQAC